MKKYLAFSFLLLSSLSFAQDRNSDAALKFCQERMTSPDALQKLISQKDNQLWFTNQGGLFGGGVCWWHSRFTRAAAYLAVFDPDQPKPTDAEAKKLIQRIRQRKGITVIPGYRNLRDFSLDYGNEIQAKLNDWQRSDGFFKASWVRGLSGDSEVTPENLAQKMEELYERVSRGEVVYQMLQMPGIVAHAWLVTGMEKTARGYQINVVDSNIGNDTYYYEYGKTTFNYLNWYKFVPYTGQVKEEKKLMEKMSEFCQSSKPAFDIASVDEETED